MSSSAWRVGFFALIGLITLALAIVLVGGRWFAATERAQMRFDSSVFGLRNGAPVVFRGVRVGQVSTIGFAAMAGGGLAIPVSAEFEREALRELLVSAGGEPAASPISGLIARGLVARLALQSILTGQLYVDLDFDPSQVRNTKATTPSLSAGLPVIPTAQSKLQTLQAQLEGLDLAKIGQDLTAIAASARQLLAGPGPTRVLERSADAAQALQRLATDLDAEVGPLSRAALATLAQSQQAIGQIGLGAQQAGLAASQVGASAGQVGATAAQAQALLGQAGQVMAELQRSAAELGRVAATLREAADADSPLRQNAERALQEVSRAARALGELGETLNRQPDALLRGRIMAP